MGSYRKRIAATLGAALVLVPVALAADMMPVRYTAADQAAAKAITLRLADLGSDWKGGAKKPDLSNDTCPTKRSDLVLTGAASSEFTTKGAAVSSEAWVLRTPAMVAADWQRTIASPSYWACGRRELASTKEARLVSVTKLSFPRLTRYVDRHRIVVDYGTAAAPALVAIDVISLGQGRSELMLMVTAPYAHRAAMDAAERRLAAILVSRLRA